MSALDALAPLATTGVGSLPFSDPRAAARHAARAYDVPFCPQLPRLDGDMVRQWLGADPGRCGWSADRDRQRPAAWDAFLAAVPGRPVVKLQVTGPVTLAIALERDGGRAGGGAASLGLAHEVAVWLGVAVAEQVERLAALGADVLLVVDEPGLAAAGLSGGDVAVWDVLRGTGAAAWGLHVCGPVPWGVVDAAAVELLSFDLTRTALDPRALRALRRLVARGGRIAWGALDPVAPAGSADAAALVAGALAAVGGAEADRVAGHSLVTPACGTGRLAPERERLVAATLATVADGVRGAVRAGVRTTRPRAGAP